MSGRLTQFLSTIYSMLVTAESPKDGKNRGEIFGPKKSFFGILSTLTFLRSDYFTFAAKAGEWGWNL